MSEDWGLLKGKTGVLFTNRVNLVILRLRLFWGYCPPPKSAKMPLQRLQALQCTANWLPKGEQPRGNWAYLSASQFLTFSRVKKRQRPTSCGMVGRANARGGATQRLLGFANWVPTDAQTHSLHPYPRQLILSHLYSTPHPPRPSANDFQCPWSTHFISFMFFGTCMLDFLTPKKLKAWVKSEKNSLPWQTGDHAIVPACSVVNA